MLLGSALRRPTAPLEAQRVGAARDGSCGPREALVSLGRANWLSPTSGRFITAPRVLPFCLVQAPKQPQADPAPPESVLLWFERPLTSLAAKPRGENPRGGDACPLETTISSFCCWPSERPPSRLRWEPKPAEKPGCFEQTRAPSQWNLYVFDNERLKAEA